MGLCGGPKKSDFEPSESDKANAAVAQAEKNYFDQNLRPLLLKKRTRSLSDDPKQIARARANADTMQGLTSNLDYNKTQDIGGSALVGQALQDQLGQAGAQGQAFINKEQAETLGMAREQASDAMSGMANIASIDTSRTLGKAKAKETERLAKQAMLGQIGGAAVLQGMDNTMTGGSFFTPTGEDGQPVKGFKNRMQHSGFLASNPFSTMPSYVREAEKVEDQEKLYPGYSYTSRKYQRT